MSGNVKSAVLSLIEKRGDTDRGLVETAKDEIKEALRHEITIGKIYEVMREYGFKGSRILFTRILEEKGVYTIRRKPRKSKSEAKPSVQA